jgi:hypothetical protein
LNVESIALTTSKVQSKRVESHRRDGSLRFGWGNSFFIEEAISLNGMEIYLEIALNLLYVQGTFPAALAVWDIRHLSSSRPSSKASSSSESFLCETCVYQTLSEPDPEYLKFAATY